MTEQEQLPSQISHESQEPNGLFGVSRPEAMIKRITDGASVVVKRIVTDNEGRKTEVTEDDWRVIRYFPATLNGDEEGHVFVARSVSDNTPTGDVPKDMIPLSKFIDTQIRAWQAIHEDGRDISSAIKLIGETWASEQAQN